MYEVETAEQAFSLLSDEEKLLLLREGPPAKSDYAREAEHHIMFKLYELARTWAAVGAFDDH